VSYSIGIYITEMKLHLQLNPLNNYPRHSELDSGSTNLRTLEAYGFRMPAGNALGV